MKGYVVTLMGMPESVRVAERCIESGKQYGIDVQIFPAVNKTDSDAELLKEGLTIATLEADRAMLPPYKREESNRGAVMGNFIAQYRIWKTILESNEPGIVLEHDAVFVSPLPEHMTQGDIVSIGVPSYGSAKKKTEPGIYPLFSKRGYLPGAHGYYVTPKGAEQLIKQAHIHGAAPCDLFLNPKLFPGIRETWPLVVEAQDEFTTIQDVSGCGAKHNYKKNKNYKILS